MIYVSTCSKRHNMNWNVTSKGRDFVVVVK